MVLKLKAFSVVDVTERMFLTVLTNFLNMQFKISSSCKYLLGTMTSFDVFSLLDFLETSVASG